MRDINRILWVLLVVGVVLLGFVSPPSTFKVFAANTITVTFDPDNNITIDVSPATLNIGKVYPETTRPYYNTSATNYTLYNNGTGLMDTTVEITSSAADMTLFPEGTPGANGYSFRIMQGTVDNNSWLSGREYRPLDNDTAAGSSVTFGISLQMGTSISSNWTQQSVTMTILGVPG